MCTRRRLTLALSHLEVNTLPVVVGGRRAAMVACTRDTLRRKKSNVEADIERLSKK